MVIIVCYNELNPRRKIERSTFLIAFKEQRNVKCYFDK